MLQIHKEHNQHEYTVTEYPNYSTVEISGVKQIRIQLLHYLCATKEKSLLMATSFSYLSIKLIQVLGNKSPDWYNKDLCKVSEKTS